MRPVLALLLSCTPTLVSAQVDVRVVPDEADAAITVLQSRLRGTPPGPSEWNRLFATAGYQHLKEREIAMGRVFSDSAFQVFLMSDTVLQRAAALERALPPLEHVDVSEAALRALVYLPPGSRLRAHDGWRGVLLGFGLVRRDARAGAVERHVRLDRRGRKRLGRLRLRTLRRQRRVLLGHRSLLPVRFNIWRRC